MTGSEDLLGSLGADVWFGRWESGGDEVGGWVVGIVVVVGIERWIGGGCEVRCLGKRASSDYKFDTSSCSCRDSDMIAESVRSRMIVNAGKLIMAGVAAVVDNEGSGDCCYDCEPARSSRFVGAELCVGTLV